MTPVLTVGHSTHPPEALVALLRGAGVELVADVRRHPGSRRLPHVRADALRELLAQGGVGCEHLEALGGRRRPVPGSVNDGWEHEAFRGYADWMASADFAAGLARLEALAAERRTAVMCAEAPWWRCHRRLVCDALLVRGWAVRHILPDGSLADHELTAFAVADGERITYPSPQLKL